MNYQVDLLEATLNHMDEAVVIVDSSSNVLFWNNASTELTGYTPQDVLAQHCPDLYSPSLDSSGPQSDKPAATTLRHKAGFPVPGMLRVFALHDALGEPSGKALLFYPSEQLEAISPDDLPRCTDLEQSHAEMSDRIEAAHHQWITAGIPFGLLWVTVDQAESLRTTHGGDACESMLRTMQQTLSRQMKPSEVIGRWGLNEFLVLAHERTPDLLVEHARRLAGVARTADFRWWGDRVNLTVSIGSASAAEGHTLRSQLNAAMDAMHSAVYAGGNQVAQARDL